MIHFARFRAFPALLILGLLAGPAFADWPQWRGPDGNGVAPDANPPVTWGEEKNILYKVEIPGQGHASPVVAGDRLYLLSAVDADEPAAETEEEEPAEGRRRRGVAPDRELHFKVFALDRTTGETVWERTAITTRPHEGTHTDGSWAAASAVTDGDRVWAFFGSRGIYAYSHAGELLWKKQLGEMTTRNAFGEGATPILAGNTLVIPWDHEGDSFAVALDASTGAERWRVTRDEPTSWSTPHVVEVTGKPQVVLNGTGRVRAYDLESGKVVWEVGGMTVNAIPSPVSADGLLYVMSGFRGNMLKAVRLAGAEGDITGKEAVVWTYDKDTPYVPSPVLYNGILYFLKHNGGILTALDADSGKVHYGPVRVEGIEGVYASLVAADGRVYVTGRNGAVTVLAAGPEMKTLAVNSLEDAFNASPALVGGTLYLRGRSHLYAIAESEEDRKKPSAPGAR
ncbi:MAG: PQQ-binding-like beta-propeller repeat protein [Acidobacteriota bacterium]